MTTAAAQIALRRQRERLGAAPPAVTMWLFPYLSFVAIGCMGAVLIAMAFTPGLQQDFKFSCITLVVTVLAYLIVRRVRQPRTAASTVSP
jgi:GABA permease